MLNDDKSAKRSGTSIATCSLLLLLSLLCTVRQLNAQNSLSNEPMDGVQIPNTQTQQQNPQNPNSPNTNSPVSNSTERTTIHGVVLSSATESPLARALVSVEGMGGKALLTDNEGRFEFKSLPLGPLVLEVTKPGFRGEDQNAVGDIVRGDHGGEGLSANIIVSADTPELTLRLIPNSALHGHIELSTGDPAQEIFVQIIGRTIINGRAQWNYLNAVKTNSSGNFRFSGLAAGTYLIRTVPANDADTFQFQSDLLGDASTQKSPKSGYPAVYYPDVRDFESAAKIDIRAGEDASANLHLTLEEYHKIRARIPQSGEAGKGVLIETPLLLDNDGVPSQFYPVRKLKDRNEVEAEVPDGSYFLSFYTSRSHVSNEMGITPQDLVDIVNQAKTGMVGVTVEGHDVLNLQMPLSSTQPIVVNLHLPQSALANAGTRNGPRDVAFIAFSHATAPAPDLVMVGAPTIDRLLFMPSVVGRYWPTVTIERPSLCVGSFIGGGADLSREPLTVQPGVSLPPLELTLRDDCAKLNLSLPYGLTLATPGVEKSLTVYAVPDFDSSQLVVPQTIRPSSGGTVSLEGLTPGNYHVYTFPTPIEFEFHNRAVLDGLNGQTVSLAPNSSVDLMLEVSEK